MQPIKQLANALASLADSDRYLFTLSDLKCVLPEHSQGAFKALLSRSVKTGLLQRICYGLYQYPPVAQNTGLILFHAAAKLRAHCFNYLSLETVLSDAGIVSQIPMNWITLMSSCRSQTHQLQRIWSYRIHSHQKKTGRYSRIPGVRSPLSLMACIRQPGDQGYAGNRQEHRSHGAYR